MTKKLLVIVAYEACYENPIELRAGDLLTLTGKRDNWEGHVWLWAKSSRDGREGWVPDNLIVAITSDKATIRSDYSAKELSCQKGQLVTRLDATHGWTLCQAGNGKLGWVPDHCLQPE